MDTLSLESLLITEDEWIATEGFGEMLKTVGGAIWGAIIGALKKLLKRISELRQKSKSRKEALRNVKNGTVPLVDLTQIIQKFYTELDSTGQSLINLATDNKFKAELSKTGLARDAIDKDFQEYVNVAKTVKIKIDEIASKYVPFDQLDPSKKEPKLTNVGALEHSITTIGMCLSVTEGQVSNMIRSLEKNAKDNQISEMGKRASRIAASTMTQWTYLYGRFASYVDWELDEIGRGYRKLESMSNSK